MAKYKCESCRLRSSYDKNPRSLLGRLWRWHASWCPGWKAYMGSLDSTEKQRLAEKYNLKRYMTTTFKE